MTTLTNLAAIVVAIWNIEGGSGTRYPYGVRSVPTTSVRQARKICENTVRNNWRRWQRAGRPGCFFDFLGDRYCPPTSDRKGNANWKRNIKARLKHQPCDCN